MAATQRADEPSAIGIDPGGVLSLKIQRVIWCKSQTSVIAEGRALIPNHHAKVDGFGGLGP